MKQDALSKTITNLVTPPRGILAADESAPTCAKRFEKFGIPTTEENRRKYREILITAPELEKYISGIILFDETTKQYTKDGRSFISILQAKGIEIGIKVDQGLKDFPGHAGEKTTEGLDGLALRMKEYRNMGATFAKWRAVYQIGQNTPSEDLMRMNAKNLAEYALICQREDIVPIIEPEVLIDGDHTIEKCYEVMAKNFDILFEEMKNLDIKIPEIILKTSMVISGLDAKVKAKAEQVAEMTVKCLKEHVPSNIGGIVFLSGGQSEEEATLHLNLMHKTESLPWHLTFSYSRAIQNPVLKYWAEHRDDISGAQKVLLEMSRQNSLASIGKHEM